MLSGDEYKDILFEILKKERENSAKPSVVRKEKLWRLLFYQLGLTDPIDTAEQKTISGCFCGIGTASILADGTFYPCRRLDVPAGNYPEKSFSELFIKNEVTKRFLDVDSYEGCSSCILRAYCRGCPASKFAVTGNFFARDPLCWV
jgi:radical SAM protein with 4Fe4S-binding SPASM domain